MMTGRSGILVVDKGPGVTSFRVVAHVRRLLKGPKMGHGGTLDPEATGVLLLLVGEATKLSSYLLEHDKEYLATVRLGVITDTQDLSGQLREEREVPTLTEETIRAMLERFTGEIQQVPPMFSALHHEGRRLYQLARKGREVPREPRSVTIHQIILEEASLPNLILRVQCGRGTYIRTLAHDLGVALGCGGALERLIRTRVGPFTLDEAIPWAELQTLSDPETVWRRLRPLDAALADWPRWELDEAESRVFLHGRSVPFSGWALGQKVVVYDQFGEVLAIGHVTPSGLTPERILHARFPRPRALST